MREMLDCGYCCRLATMRPCAAGSSGISRKWRVCAFIPAARERGRGRRTAGAGGHGRDAQALRCLPDAGRAGHAGLDPHRLAAGAAVPGHAHPGAGRRHEGVGHRGPAGAGRGRFHFRTRLPGRVARALAPSAAVGCVGAGGGLARRARLALWGAGPGGPRARRPAASSPGRDARSRTGPRVGPGSRRLAAGRDASTRGVGLVRPGHGEPAVAAPLAGRRRAIRRPRHAWWASSSASTCGAHSPITAATWRRPPGRPASTAAHSGR